MRLIKRYNIDLAVWEIGYWAQTRFIILGTIAVKESV